MAFCNHYYFIDALNADGEVVRKRKYRREDSKIQTWWYDWKDLPISDATEIARVEALATTHTQVDEGFEDWGDFTMKRNRVSSIEGLPMDAHIIEVLWAPNGLAGELSFSLDKALDGDSYIVLVSNSGDHPATLFLPRVADTIRMSSAEGEMQNAGSSYIMLYPKQVAYVEASYDSGAWTFTMHRATAKDLLQYSIPEADYLLIRFNWNHESGDGLDTAFTTSGMDIAVLDGMAVGYDMNGNTSSVNEYLEWGGENTGSGKENVAIKLSALRNNLGDAAEDPTVRGYATWFTSEGGGLVTMEMLAYKGGTLSKDGTVFQVEDGELVWSAETDAWVKSLGGADDYANNYTLLFMATVSKDSTETEVSSGGAAAEKDFILEIVNSFAGINDTVEQIQNQISEIQGDITTINQNIENIEGDVTNIQGDVSNLQTTVNEHTTQISEIQGDITSIEENIDQVEENVSNIQNTVNQHTEQISTIEGNIDTINQNIENLEETVEQHTEQISTIEGNIETINTNIEGLQETVNQHTTQISEIQGDITEIQGDITDIQGDVSDLQTTVNEHTTQISELQTNVSNLENTVSEHTTQISSLQGDVSDLQTTVSEHTTQISSLQSDVSELQTTVEEHTTQIEAIEEDIEAMKVDISQALCITLDSKPTSSTVSYTDGDSTVNFVEGAFVRVYDDDAGSYEFWKLANLSGSTATWVKMYDTRWGDVSIETTYNKDFEFVNITGGTTLNAINSEADNIKFVNSSGSSVRVVFDQTVSGASTLVSALATSEFTLTDGAAAEFTRVSSSEYRLTQLFGITIFPDLANADREGEWALTVSTTGQPVLMEIQEIRQWNESIVEEMTTDTLNEMYPDVPQGFAVVAKTIGKIYEKANQYDMWVATDCVDV